MTRRKKWIRRSRRLVLAALCLVVGALLLANVAVNAPPLKGKMEGLASGQLGQPVRIGWSSYWPWAGARLNGVRVGEAGAPLLVTDVRVRVAPWKFVRQWLSGGDVEIGSLECIDPKFSLALPEPQTIRVVANAPSGEPRPAPVPAEVPVPAIAPDVTPSEPAPSPPTAPVPEPPVRGRGYLLAKVKLSGGEIVIEDRAGGRPVARVEGLEFELLPSGAPDAYLAGAVRLGAVSFMGRRIAGSGSAQVSWKPLGFEIRDIELPFEGGVFRGVAKVEATSGRPFMAEFAARGIDLVALLGDLGGDAPVALLAGEGQAKVRLQGLATAPGDARARIALSASGVKAQIGEGAGGAPTAPGGLDIGPDGAVGLTEVKAVFDLVRGNLLLSEAGARSGGLWVKSAGRLGRDGGLDLVTRLYAAGDLRGAIERGAAAGGEGEGEGEGVSEVKFRRLPETDWYYHDFRVGGSVARPLADFWNRGEAMPVGALLDTLFKNAGLVAAGPPGEAGAAP